MRQRHVRSRDQIKQALEIQRRALDASAKSYDGGNRWEALRLATAVYNLVHDGGNIRSLLTQLGIRGALRFFAPATPHNPRNLVRETLLVMIHLYSDGTAEYVPLLDNGPPLPSRRLQFHDWWEKDIILSDGEFKLTRKRLVFILRNQEGGGHFSTEMNDHTYMRFSQAQLTTPLVVAPGKPTKPILGVELATMRQIAWELTKTLDDHGPIESR